MCLSLVKYSDTNMIVPTNNLHPDYSSEFLGTFTIPEGYQAITYGYFDFLTIVNDKIINNYSHYLIGCNANLHCNLIMKNNEVIIIDPTNEHIEIPLEKKKEPKNSYNVIFIFPRANSRNPYYRNSMTRCDSIKEAISKMEWSHCDDWLLYKVPNKDIYKCFTYNRNSGYFVWDKNALPEPDNYVFSYQS